MSQELVFIATFDNSLLANIAKGRLEAEGIAAFLHNERALEMQWLWTNASGGIGLLVPESDAGRARAILAEPVAADATATDESAPDRTADLEDTAQEPNLREQDAVRAFKSAILGILFCP
jgi:hypothetical protein